MFNRRMAGLSGVGLLIAAPARAAPIPLILPQEAQLPPPREAPVATRGVTRGPIIRLVSPGPSPLNVTAPFWLRVEFMGRGGARIDPASLRVLYLRSWEVDISERLRPHVSVAALEVREAAVPSGHHVMRLEIRDVDGRLGESLLAVTMR